MRFSNDVKTSYNELNAQKKILDKTIDRINALDTDTKEVDIRIEKINKEKELIKDVEDRINVLSNTYNRLQTEVNKLNEKDKNIKDILHSINMANNRIEDMHKQFHNYDKDMGNLLKKNNRLSKYIRETEDKVLQVSGSESKIEEALSKFEELDELRIDIETRVKQIQKMRTTLAGQQREMERLIKDSDARISNMIAVMNNLRTQFEEKQVQSSSQASAKRVSPPRDDKTKAILRLAGQGWTIAEIAKSVNLSESEVELIIQMNK